MVSHSGLSVQFEALPEVLTQAAVEVLSLRSILRGVSMSYSQSKKGPNDDKGYLWRTRWTGTEEMMLYLMSSNLKEGRLGEYCAWLKKNKKSIQDHAPPGWKYRGTYGSVLGFGRYDVTDIWEIKKYGDFDVFRNWKDKASLQLSAEQLDFFLPGTGEATLLREFSDIVFLEPKKPKRSKK